MSVREPDLVLPVATGQALLDYLVSQPYRDVYQLVAALQTLEPIPTGNSFGDVSVHVSDDENAP
jgi:hypothetical protein